MNEAYRMGRELRGLFDFGRGLSEAPDSVPPGQGVEISYCVGKGDDHALRFSRIEHWNKSALDLTEDAGSTEENRRVSAIKVAKPGVYHVAAGMRFGRPDGIHAWGVTLNSQRSSERNVIGMGQAFVLARVLRREAENEGSYTTLSWTGFLQKDDLLHCLVEPQQLRLYTNMSVDPSGFFRAHFLLGA